MENLLSSAGDARSVDAGRGVAWWTEAWAQFMKNAGMWIVLALVWFVIFLVLGFIPFLGGLTIPSRPPPSELSGVMIALAGPALGILMVLPQVGVFHLTGDPQWLIGAFFVTILNIFNLFPAPPLDGSRVLGPVLARVHPNLERVVAVKGAEEIDLAPFTEDEVLDRHIDLDVATRDIFQRHDISEGCR